MGRAPCCDKANVKKGPWSPEEDSKLKEYIEKHGTGGNWIALPQKAGLKRCGKSCRLRWLNYLRPNIKHGDFSDEEDRIICSLFANIGSRWSIIAAQLPGRTDNDIKNYWNTKLKKKLMGMLTPSHSDQTQTRNIVTRPCPPFQASQYQNPSLFDPSHEPALLPSSSLYKEYYCSSSTTAASPYYYNYPPTATLSSFSGNIESNTTSTDPTTTTTTSLATHFPLFQNQQDWVGVGSMQYNNSNNTSTSGTSNYHPIKDNFLMFGLTTEGSCSSSSDGSCGQMSYGSRDQQIKQEQDQIMGTDQYFQNYMINNISSNGFVRDDQESQKLMTMLNCNGVGTRDTHQNMMNQIIMGGLKSSNGYFGESRFMDYDLEDIKRLISSNFNVNDNINGFH